jgi:hypothetical protein
VDTAALAKSFGEQAVLITPVGGGTDRRSIQNRIAQEHEGRLRGTRLKPDIVAIDFPTDNIAVLEGNYQIAGVRVGLRSTRTLEGPFVVRFQRNGHHWEIVRARLYGPSEKNLALRDAHNERYPFIQSAQAEAMVISNWEASRNEKPGPRPVSWMGDVDAAEPVQRIVAGW